MSILALQSRLINKIQQDCAVESDISTACLTKWLKCPRRGKNITFICIQFAKCFFFKNLAEASIAISSCKSRAVLPQIPPNRLSNFSWQSTAAIRTNILWTGFKEKFCYSFLKGTFDKYGGNTCDDTSRKRWTAHEYICGEANTEFIKWPFLARRDMIPSTPWDLAQVQFI